MTMAQVVSKPEKAKIADKNLRPAAASAPEPFPSLSELQARMQAAIVNGDNTVLADILDKSRTTRQTLLGVYQHAYVGRLKEVLKGEYPILALHLSMEKFDDMASAYIAEHPSRNPNARWFGQRLAEFLSQYQKFANFPEVSELAALEWALGEAFDATDEDVLGLSNLAGIAPEEWERLVFTLHPSVGQIEAKTNVFAVWRALKKDEPPPAIEVLAEPDKLIIWRQDVVPMVRQLGREESMMWAEAGRGVRFGVLCEMLAAFDDPENAAVRAAGYLYGWITAGMLSTVMVDSERR